MSDPGYYFLPGDYARDTAHLTNDEDLAYRRLLDAYYSRGTPFPAPLGWLQRVARVPLEAVQTVAEEFFPINGDGLRHNRRADEEIKKRSDFISAQAERGRASWEARKGRGQTTAIAPIQTTVRLIMNGGSFPVRTGDEPPSPSPSPKEEKKIFLRYVLLTGEEEQKLRERLNESFPVMLERLDGYIGQIGTKKAAKYKSHYDTILNWWRKDHDEKSQGEWDGKSAPRN